MFNNMELWSLSSKLSNLLWMAIRYISAVTQKALVSVFPIFTSRRSLHDRTSPSIVDESTIPSEPNITFPAWTKTTPLPSPADVRAHKLFIKKGFRAQVVHFEHLGLVVKYGRRIHIAEAYSMWLVSKHTSIPIPKLYGWATENDETFVYYEFLPGYTLESRWPGFTSEQKEDVARQVHVMVQSLRTLTLPKTIPSYIGSPRHGEIHDNFVHSGGNNGPFRSVQEFNDRFCAIGGSSEKFRALIRHHLPLDCRVVFTHADIHLANILVSTTDPCRIVGIIDWAQAGWWPDWWETMKATWVAERGSDWKSFIPTILGDHEDTLQAAWILTDAGIVL